MAEPMKDKLAEIKSKLEQTPKLSAEEKIQIEATFEALTEVLNNTLEVILELDRVEAYRYTGLFVSGFMQIDANFMGGVKAPKIVEEIEGVVQTVATGPIVKVDLAALVQDLPLRMRGLAKRLSCVKQLEELGDEIICPDCSLERLIECVRIEDPTIDPAQDIIDEVKKMRAAQSN